MSALRGKPFNPFRAAKPYLWDGSRIESYGTVILKNSICNAITEAREQLLIWGVPEGKCDPQELRELRLATKIAQNMINNRLGDYAYAGSWLLDWLEENGQPPATVEQIQQWRHAWLDHLANEWDEGIRE